MNEAHALLDALPEPTVLVDRDVVVHANPAFSALLGKSGSALPGSPWRDLFGRGSADRLGAIFDTDDSRPFGVRARLRVGLERPLHAVHVGRVDERRRLLSFRPVAGATQFDELVLELSRIAIETGNALHDVDALFAAARPVFESLGWLIVVLEVGAHDLVLREIFWPGIADRDELPGRRLLGLSVPQESLGNAWAKLRDGEPTLLDFQDQGQIAAFLERLSLTTGEISRYRALVDEQAWTRGAWAPAMVDGRVTYIVGAIESELVAADLAAVRLFASQIATTVKTSSMSRAMARKQRGAALGQMSTLLAHEVRNPLAIMFQAFRQLRRRVSSTVEVGELLDIVQEEAERLSSLVDDLVSFAGPLRPRIEPVALAGLAALAHEGLRYDASKVRVQIDVAEDLPSVRADPGILRNALAHLLSNAIAHVERGGHVVLTAERESGERVAVRVADDGDPIPDDVRSRIFEPFFTTKARGSGLGLAVVKRLVEELGGSVELESRSTGKSFVLHLPVAAEAVRLTPIPD